MSRKNLVGAAALVVLGASVLAGCSDVTYTPEESKWETVSTTSIVSMETQQSVYIRGGMFHVEGGSYTDYQYATKAGDGGIIVSRVSDLWRAGSVGGDNTPMPEGSVVIYQDVTKDSGKSPSIIVRKCIGGTRGNDGDSWDDALPTCTTVYGHEVGYDDSYVEVHVPPNSVVKEDQLSPKEEK